MISDRRVGAAKKAQTARLGQSGAAGKRKRCKKGKSCGASCINSSKFCLVDLPWVGKGLVRVRNEIQDSTKVVKETNKPPTFQPASQALPTKSHDVNTVLTNINSPVPKTTDVEGILKASEVNWESGRGKGAEYVASGSFGSFIHIPEERLAKGLEGKFPGGVGIKYGQVSPKEVELLKKIGESGAGPRFIAAKYESEPIIPGANPDSKARIGMIAMERIPGTALNKLWASDQITNAQLGDVYLKGISKLHKAGIFHGDAHLGNAILQPNGEVKFIDFGASQINPLAALSEIQSRISDYNMRGSVRDTILKNLDRVRDEMDKTKWNDGSMTQEAKDKKAMEFIDKIYKGV